MNLELCDSMWAVTLSDEKAAEGVQSSNQRVIYLYAWRLSEKFLSPASSGSPDGFECLKMAFRINLEKYKLKLQLYMTHPFKNIIRFIKCLRI